MEMDTMFLFSNIKDMIEAVEKLDKLAIAAEDKFLESEVDTFAQSVARSIMRQVDDFLEGHTMRKMHDAPMIKECDPELERLLAEEEHIEHSNLGEFHINCPLCEDDRVMVCAHCDHGINHHRDGGTCVICISIAEVEDNHLICHDFDN